MDPFFVICVSCLAVMPNCLLLAALWSPAGKGLATLIFSCVFITFPYSVLGQVWYWILENLVNKLCRGLLGDATYQISRF